MGGHYQGVAIGSDTLPRNRRTQIFYKFSSNPRNSFLLHDQVQVFASAHTLTPLRQPSPSSPHQTSTCRSSFLSPYSLPFPNAPPTKATIGSQYSPPSFPSLLSSPFSAQKYRLLTASFDGPDRFSSARSSFCSALEDDTAYEADSEASDTSSSSSSTSESAGSSEDATLVESSDSSETACSVESADSDIESLGCPSDASDVSAWGRNLLNGDGTVCHGSDVEVEEEEDSAYEAEEGWRIESDSESEEDSASEEENFQGWLGLWAMGIEDFQCATSRCEAGS